MAISPRARFEVLKRDGFRCVYCGAPARTSRLEIDHVVATANGGSDDSSNLVTACSTCNSGKSNVPLDQVRLAPDRSAEEAHEHDGLPDDRTLHVAGSLYLLRQAARSWRNQESVPAWVVAIWADEIDRIMKVNGGRLGVAAGRAAAPPDLGIGPDLEEEDIPF